MDATARADDETSGRVPYDRQTLQHPNPIARFAHRRRHSLSLALATDYVRPNGAILDFGAGTGEFLHQLGQRRPDIRLFAFEPYMAVRHPEIEWVSRLDALPPASFAAVSAFEVCEHLELAQIDDLLAQCRRLLEPGGRLLLSVPIMEGLGLPLKELTRSLLFRRRSDYAPGELLRGSLGRLVARAPDRLGSHKGFAHRALWSRLLEDFAAIDDITSPIGRLPWWLNSQRFGVFSIRDADAG
jgi:SAM-dependent methyltransferase